jgi:hypothetical protein
MVGWRLALITVLAAILVVGWGLIFFGNLTSVESGATMTVVILGFFEAVCLIVVGGVWFFSEIVPKWYKRVQCACPKVHWTEEK